MNKLEEKIRNMPIIKVSYGKSKDGRYFIVRTTITDIKPIKYLDKVLSGSSDDKKNNG